MARRPLNYVAASIRSGVALVAASFVLTSCTAPVEATTDDVITAAGKTLPFSYDTNMDTLTHMSCSNMTMSNPLPYNGSAYFTFRMGAYSTGGITLKDDFYTTLKRYSFQKQEEILAASPDNSSTVLQMALRGENRQSIKVRSGSTPVQGQDYSNMLTPLGEADVNQMLVNNPKGSRIRQIRNGAAGGYRLEGSLYFTQGAASVQDARDFAAGNSNTSGSTGLLAVTYTNGSSYSARSAATSATKTTTTVNPETNVYGRGYRPYFTQPSYTGIYSSYPANVMASVSETSLDGTSISPTPSWNCPSSMNLRIVRAEDAGTNVPGVSLVRNGVAYKCSKKADPAVLTPELAILRRTLKIEDWYIDLDARCIIPKRVTTGCYGPVTDVRYVQSEACGVIDANGNSNCVQYASTCYRN